MKIMSINIETINEIIIKKFKISQNYLYFLPN
jgi:hypothetical protein